MRAKELRLGNYFHPIDKRNELLIPNTTIYLQVGSIDVFGNVNVIEHHLEPVIKFHVKNMEPILLTEEWLKDFGFEHSSDNTWSKGPMLLSFQKSENSFWVYLGGSDVASMQCVHQLQNLYFALTGEELERSAHH